MKALDVTNHKIHLTNILIDIYKDSTTGSVLGFKGGTAALLFYGLPRFSVDLDFDFMAHDENNANERNLFVEKMTRLLSVKYAVKNQSTKQHTLFWLVSYGTGLTQIKIEISSRENPDNHYHATPFYGVSVNVLDIGDMIAHKLIAVMDRKRLASRDIFDCHYFLSSPWADRINGDIIRRKTGKEPPEFYKDLLNFVGRIPPTRVLTGLGEIVSSSQKRWIKERLLTELVGLIQRQIDL